MYFNTKLTYNASLTVNAGLYNSFAIPRIAQIANLKYLTGKFNEIFDLKLNYTH